jgi:UDP-glucose 4-epimerase
MVTATLEKIVVTGAGGFLGRAVMAGLKALDLPATGVCRRPVDGMIQLNSYLETPGADVVIHLAEEPDRAKVNGDDEAYVHRSADVVRSLCGRSGKVIYASSGTIYGDDAERPFTPDIPAIETDLYSRSKIENERIVLAANGTALRLSNLYGRRMSPNNVFSDILKQIPGGGALFVRDDQPVRDFLFVDDAAQAFVLAARSSCRGILNVGSGNGTSIGALARLALQSAGEGHREIVATKPSGRASFNVLEVSETRERIGWSCRSSLHDYFFELFGSGVKVVAS